MKIAVSSCLLGINCKYNGKSNYNEDILKLKEKYELIPICPEVLRSVDLMIVLVIIVCLSFQVILL